MIFLVVYSRQTQTLLLFKQFSDMDSDVAERERLEAELDAGADGDVEALLLRARDEATVRSSHARYFEDASSLLRDLRKGA
jgi:hypothetical protein